MYKLFYEVYASLTSQIENLNELDINQTYFDTQCVGKTFKRPYMNLILRVLTKLFFLKVISSVFTSEDFVQG
jgi:hypothetical protein